ncbi:Na+/H+ antiporter subunit E [Microlunatus speluncae]|uniref:Na+/H+ antiporter subunit E n=1 Tax=Microlunatus speluncae TaxID=2594267 RepID=UPI0012660F90|nr:Na+/H+ antiporter subunit E [Microlunatus speluncae]
MTGPDEPELPPRRNGLQPATIIVLAVVWIVLWGELSLLIVLSGLLVGLLVTLLFPLPPIPYTGRIRPLALLWTLLRLLGDLVVASFEVTRTILRPGRPPRAAIVRVQLRSDSDLYQTLTAELVSLVPGSIVIEARRSSRTLYLHVLDVTDEADLDRVRREVRTAEAWVLRSLGSAEERALLTDREAP